MVVRVVRFLLGQQLCVFLFESVDRRQLGKAEGIKMTFRGLVLEDGFLMFRTEFSTISSVPIGHIGFPSPAINGDLFLQFRNVRHTLIGSFNFIGQHGENG